MASRIVGNPERKILMSQFCLSNYQKSKTISAGDPNKEVRMDQSPLGCPVRDTPTCQCSTGGGPVDKVPPTNLHILSPVFLQDLTKQLPATLKVHKTEFKVDNKNSLQC